MLDPVLQVRMPKRKHSNDDLCLICNSQSNVPFVSQPTETICMKFLDSIVSRVQCSDDNCVLMRNRIGDNVTFESFQNRDFKWHAGCYKTITHKSNYEKLEKRFSEAKLSEHDRPSTSHLKRHTRAKNTEYKKETCFFCDQESCKRNILRKVATDNAGANLTVL